LPPGWLRLMVPRRSTQMRRLSASRRKRRE
jgi:hypothetical protein